MGAVSSNGAAKAASESYVLRVELQDIEPAIWRTLQVPAAMSLAQLHRALQIAMGWENAHLHQFITSDGRCFGESEPELRLLDHHAACVADVLGPDQDLVYEYDFGDCWRHRLSAEETLKVPSGQVRLLAGERACPPEDAGGAFGFMELLTFFDPGSTCDMCEEEREEGDGDRCTDCAETYAWLGSYNPDKFKLEKTAARLAKDRW